RVPAARIQPSRSRGGPRRGRSGTLARACLRGRLERGAPMSEIEQRANTIPRPRVNGAASAAVAAAAAARAAPDWDLVLNRNNLEPLKRDKLPLEIVTQTDELGGR